jgi:hypothetical protein
LQGRKDEEEEDGTTWSKNKALDLYAEELGFNPGRDTGYPEGFHSFTQPSQYIAGTVHRLSHYRFVPNHHIF